MKKQKRESPLCYVRTETSTSAALELLETIDEESEIYTSATNTNTNTSTAGAGEAGDTSATNTNTSTAGADEVGDTFAATLCEQQPNITDGNPSKAEDQESTWYRSQMVDSFYVNAEESLQLTRHAFRCEEDLVPEMPLVAEQLQSMEPASVCEEEKEESFSMQREHQQLHPHCPCTTCLTVACENTAALPQQQQMDAFDTRVSPQTPVPAQASAPPSISPQDHAIDIGLPPTITRNAHALRGTKRKKHVSRHLQPLTAPTPPAQEQLAAIKIQAAYRRYVILTEMKAFCCTSCGQLHCWNKWLQECYCHHTCYPWIPIPSFCSDCTYWSRENCFARNHMTATARIIWESFEEELEEIIDNQVTRFNQDTRLRQEGPF